MDKTIEKFCPTIPMRCWFGEPAVQKRFKELQELNPDRDYHDIRRYFHEDLFQYSRFGNTNIPSKENNQCESTTLNPPCEESTSDSNKSKVTTQEIPTNILRSVSQIFQSTSEDSSDSEENEEELVECLILNLPFNTTSRKQIILELRKILGFAHIDFVGFKKHLGHMVPRIRIENPVRNQPYLTKAWGPKVKLQQVLPSFHCVLKGVGPEFDEEDVISEAARHGLALSNAVRVHSRATNKPTTLIRIHSTNQTVINDILNNGFRLYNRSHQAEPSHPLQLEKPTTISDPPVASIKSADEVTSKSTPSRDEESTSPSADAITTLLDSIQSLIITSFPEFAPIFLLITPLISTFFKNHKPLIIKDKKKKKKDKKNTKKKYKK